MAKINLAEKMYAWGESLIMQIVPKNNVGLVFKWIFKIPILQYKLGLGWMIGHYILLLTTVGRKSGKPRYTPLEYIYDRKNDRYRIAAGWGGNTDWYKMCAPIRVSRCRWDARSSPRLPSQPRMKKWENT